VKRACENISLAQVIHAPDSDSRRKRGYPINVGIEHCLNTLPGIQYLFLLDDDDIVYPFFTRMMADAFEQSGADLVYANSNRREAGKPLAPSFPLKPYYHLLEQNFIPSNAYAVRTDALRRSDVRVDESFEYLEDWHFLLRMLESGLRFYRLDMTLSEFRTESDADYAFRNDLELWRSYSKHIRQYINRTSFPIPGADLALLAQSQAVPTEVGGRFTDSSTTAALHRRIWELEHSLSWKVTEPLRSVLGSLMRMKRH
jgi:glycosyltransferase involved in cell wall biosynthesis